MNAAEYVLAGGLAVAGPDKPAIVSGDGSVTYGELTVRASRLAAALREAARPLSGGSPIRSGTLSGDSRLTVATYYGQPRS